MSQSPTPKPKRFYRTAGIEADGEAWRVVLDGRTVKTPAAQPLALPSEPLASAIAEEWQRQGETIEILRMHLTRLANVAIDRAPGTRNELIDEICRYGETDLLCFLADDDALRTLQDEVWRPIRDHAARKRDILLIPVQGLIATRQPDASLLALRAYAGALDNFRLTGLAYGCGLFGSVLLSMALSEAELGAASAFDASVLDERFQEERWGQDAEAIVARDAKRVEAEALEQWFQALAAPSYS